MISVIIPVLNAESTISRTLSGLLGAMFDGIVKEVIVVDGGSVDGTRDLVIEAGAKLVQAEPGRGRQLRTGVAAAEHDWLLFLHGDTVLSSDWVREVQWFTQENAGREPKAAAFRFALDDQGVQAAMLEKMVAIRSHALKLPYGDQGLLIRRDHYEELGGYADIPLMEDVDIVRRIGRRRLTILNARALTSAERFKKSGYILRSTKNLSILGLYFLKVPPRLLARLYD